MCQNWIQLDYANSNLSFVIILPNNRTRLQALESQLRSDHLPQIMNQMTYGMIDIKIPKFSVQSEFNLKEILSNVSNLKSGFDS